MSSADISPSARTEAGDRQPDAKALTANSPPPAASPQSRPVDHAELLSRVWQQSLPLMRERVRALGEAAQLVAATGDLPAAARTDAADLAHKLAGSLGMFGYPEGTAIAREMEDILEADGSTELRRLAELAGRLRTALPL